jgi:hypothetical protein
LRGAQGVDVARGTRRSNLDMFAPDAGAQIASSFSPAPDGPAMAGLLAMTVSRFFSTLLVLSEVERDRQTTQCWVGLRTGE